ncbi:Protein cms1 [Tilletia horrida]|nr:Protein cms1 [Tilletia horrida]
MADALDENYYTGGDEDFSAHLETLVTRVHAMADRVKHLSAKVARAEAQVGRASAAVQQSQSAPSSSSAAAAAQKAQDTPGNRRRKRQQLRARVAQKQDPAQNAGMTDPDKAFGQYPMDVQSIYLAMILDKFDHKLSPIEALEYPLNSTHLLDVRSAWKTLLAKPDLSDQPPQPRPSVNVKPVDIGLAKFLKTALKNSIDDLLREPSAPVNTLPGAPAILVLTADAGRAATLCTELGKLYTGELEMDKDGLPVGPVPPPAKKTKYDHDKGKQKQTEKKKKSGAATAATSMGKVAKLFGRHFKVEDQRAYLAEHPAPIAVGTPARIRALIESAASSASDANEASGPSAGAEAESSTAKGKGKGKGKGKDKDNGKDNGKGKSKADADMPYDAHPALNLDHLEYVILDITHRDERKRNLLESNDARPEMLRLLATLWKMRKVRAAQVTAELGKRWQGAVERKVEVLKEAKERKEEEEKKKKKKASLVAKKRKADEDGDEEDAPAAAGGALANSEDGESGEDEDGSDVPAVLGFPIPPLPSLEFSSSHVGMVLPPIPIDDARLQRVGSLKSWLVMF